MTVGAISNSVPSLGSFLPLLTPSLPGPSSSSSPFSQILDQFVGFEHLRGQIHTAVEQIKLENEEALFSKRGETPNGRAIESLQMAAETLEFVRSAITGGGGAAFAQANVNPGIGAQLLF